jgi:putative transposase
LVNGVKGCQDEWTGSIAVGSTSFIETIRACLGFKAIGRDIKEGDGAYQLSESTALYGTDFKAEKNDIDLETTYFWDLKVE